MTIIMILLAVIGGAMLSIQAAINGQLGSKVGVFKSAFLTFSVGALVTGLLIFFFEPKHALTLMDVPKWQLLGAMFGVPYIVIMVLAVQRIGAAVATVAVIFGQLTMSMLIDNFGWLGNASIPFSMSRLGAIVCLGSRCSSFTQAANQKPRRRKYPYGRKPLTNKTSQFK
jgi:transporter family-2 protein